MKGILANAFRYPAPIWELFSQTPCAGIFKPGTRDLVQVRVGTPANGAVLELSIIWRKHHVMAARFRAHGCPVTVAVGAWLALRCRGRSAAELSQLSAAEISRALEISEDRAHCAVMGEDVVHAVLGCLRSEVKT